MHANYGTEFEEDLQHVSKDVPRSGHVPSRAVLRNSVAPFLRKWLCDNGLEKSFPSVGKNLKVSCSSDKSAVDYCKRGYAIYWHVKVPFGDLSISGGAPVDDSHAPLPILSPLEVEQNLNHFLIQKVGYRKQEGSRPDQCFVKRRDAVRYLCDQRGGTHTHLQGKKKRPVIDALEKEIGVDFDNKSVLFANQLTQIDLADESRSVYTFLHSITYDTFVRFRDAWEQAGIRKS